MKKILFTAAFVSLFAAQSVFAISASVTRTIGLQDGGTGPIDTSIDFSIAKMNTILNDTFDKFGSTADFATASSNTLANTYNTATFTGFQDYDLFSVSTGFMLATSGIIVPGDSYGASAGIAGNIGIKANWLLNMLDIKDKNRFYLNLKFGLVPFLPAGIKKYDFGDTDIKFDSMMLGLGANYSIIETKKFSLLGMDIAKWKGVSLGTGLYYTSQDLTLTQSINQQTTNGVADVYFNGNIPFSISSYNVTVPVEALTAVQLLIFNISAGAGLDLNVGSTKLSAVPSDSIRSAQAIPTTSIATGDQIARVDVNLEDGSSSIIRLKLLAGIGLVLGPVKIEVPFYYYPSADAGVGINFGIVW